jgi:two-component system, cell cycle sensor histidine kinase and response regulator CckA
MWNSILPSPSPTSFSLPEKWSLQRTLFVTSAIFTFFLSVIYLFNPPAVRFLNNKSTDILLKTAAAMASDLDIVLVDIDEASLKKYGQWPWSRHLFSKLFKVIQDGGAKSIGIDIIFPERDRHSPENWIASLAKDFGYILDTSNIPPELLDNDLLLAGTLAQGPFTLGYKFFFSNGQESGPECQLPPITFTRANRGGKTAPHINYYRAHEVLCNYQQLTNAAPSSGFLNGTPDPDGIIRRLPLLIEFNGKIYPSFALALLLQYHNQKSLLLHTDAAHINRLSFAGLDIPLDEKGNFLLGPVQPSQATRYSAADILAGKGGDLDLQNKLVLVGSTVAGLAQGYPTPFSAADTLLDLQALALRSLSSRMPAIRTPFFPFCETTVSVVLSLCLVVLITRLQTCWSLGYSGLLAGAVWIGGLLVYQRSGYLLSPLLPTITILFNAVLLTTLRFRYLQQQAKFETGNALLLLKSSETSLESILHAIPDIIFRLDNSGNITFISQAISKYIKSPENILGRPIFDYVVPEDRNRAQYKLNERRTGERATVDLELRLLFTREDKDAEEDYRFFSVTAEGIYRNNVPDPQEFIGTQGIVKDITDRKRLERQLVQAQKMEVLGNLAAGIAHDLNNILSGLVSYPDLLLLEIPRNNPLYEKISVIQKSGQKASIIVQDLLTFARLNIANAGIINMNTIITEYLDSIEFRHLQEKHPKVTILSHLDNGLMNVKGSSVHLSKVIMNLLHNAIEAMPAGGRVTISTGCASLMTNLDCYETIPAGEYVTTSVVDNGVGISERDLHHIFEPFYSRKTTGKSGTGLGMMIIWATIKDHNGYLDIRSQEGKGTAFTFYLPAVKEPADVQKPRFVLEDYTGSETILVADANAAESEITRNMLTKLGYTVLAATGGAEALHMVKIQPVDLVILDVSLDGRPDCLETSKEILRIAQNKKVLVTSNSSGMEQAKELQQCGAEEFLQKPFTLEKLGTTVRKKFHETNNTGITR